MSDWVLRLLLLAGLLAACGDSEDDHKSSASGGAPDGDAGASDSGGTATNTGGRASGGSPASGGLAPSAGADPGGADAGGTDSGGRLGAGGDPSPGSGGVGGAGTADPGGSAGEAASGGTSAGAPPTTGGRAATGGTADGGAGGVSGPVLSVQCENCYRMPAGAVVNACVTEARCTACLRGEDCSVESLDVQDRWTSACAALRTHCNAACLQSEPKPACPTPMEP
jgi:hypothetical protein